MTGFAWLCLIIALGYPIVRWRVHRFNDRAEEALRQKGINVPYRKRQVRQGVPPVHQPPPGLGMRGPVEGKIWGQFLP
jgi:hypothetical protein